MNIHHIHYAIEIAHYGSFNKAAANLFISQPSLSRAIKELERNLGFELFVRTPSGVVPTHQGQEFLRRASHLNQQYVSLRDQYMVNHRFPVTQLSLVAFRCVIVELALIRLYERYKDQEYLNLCVCEECVEKIIDLVYDGLYSVGLILVSEENREALYQKCQRRDICWTSISELSAYIQVGQDHPLAQKHFVTQADLLPYPRATMTQDDMEPSLYGSHVHGYNPLTQPKRIVVNDKSTMYALLTNTDAYYIGLNLSNVRRGNQDIAYIPIQNPNNSYSLVFLYLKQHQLSPIESELLETIQSIITSANQ